MGAAWLWLLAAGLFEIVWAVGLLLVGVGYLAPSPPRRAETAKH